MKQKPLEKSPVADRGWQTLYSVGGISACLFIILVIVPMSLVAAAPLPPASGGEQLLRYISSHKAVYMAELICFVGLAAPALLVFLALGAALGRADRSLAAIGAVLGISSEIVALALGSSPPSLGAGLVLLSDRYVLAAGEAQRASLAAGAEALAASSNAVSAAGILTAAAILVLSVGTRKGPFHKAVSVIGIVTGALGIVSEAFRQLIGPGYILFGLLLPTWFALAGWKLLSMGRPGAGRPGAGRPSHVRGRCG